MKNRQPLRAFVPLLIVSLVAAACGPTANSGSNPKQNTEVAAKADGAIDNIVNGGIDAAGPNGNPGTPASEIALTGTEIAKIQSKNATAAIVLHYGGNAWSQAQVAGLKKQFDKLGIQVIAVTSANFEAAKQVKQINSVLAKNPDIIVSIPTDPAATARAYQKASKQGVELVFMDNPAEGMKAGDDYVSVVSSANYANGVISAHQMAKYLGGSGKIGMIEHSVPFFVNDQREQGFKETIKQEYPDIEIVAKQGITGTNPASEAQAAANAMLTQHPTLDGIWAVWAVPAEGVMAAARATGRSDLVVTTVDLELPVALSMAEKELTKGLSSQRPFDQGVVEAKLAGYALLGKEVPPFVVVPPLPVTHANVLRAWQEVFHEAPPENLKKAYEGE